LKSIQQLVSEKEVIKLGQEVVKLGQKVIYHPYARDRVNKLRIGADGKTELIQIGDVEHVGFVSYVEPSGNVNLCVFDSKGVPYIALDVADQPNEEGDSGWYKVAP